MKNREKVITYRITNRVLVLALDELYRQAVSSYERDELLPHARSVATKLAVAPADVPVEGYYAQDVLLAEYFRLIRALQSTSASYRASVATLHAFKRLEQVTSSPIFGVSQPGESLLPRAVDALTRALNETRSWALDTVVENAARMARTSSEVSLVAVAALASDPVTLAAVRESVVLYAEIGLEGLVLFPTERKFLWLVDSEVSERANQFIADFNDLFDSHLPSAQPQNAEIFWDAYGRNDVTGRCVYIGVNPQRSMPHYHWAIHRAPGGDLQVLDFWAPRIWTTDRFREMLGTGGTLLGRPS
jgi:hypothetical protein